MTSTITRPTTGELFKLAAKIHQGNKERGFWDKERNQGEILMLCVSELAEALEADRKGKSADVESYLFALQQNKVSFLKDSFLRHIKDSRGDELADTVIRLLDYAHFLYENNLASDVYHRSEYELENMGENFAANLLSITNSIYCLTDFAEDVFMPIYQVEQLCEKMDIDLWFHVRHKLKYNSTRAHKHGKKY